jgi:hypothetical protein
MREMMDLEARIQETCFDQMKAEIQTMLKESVFRSGLSCSLCSCPGSAAREAVVLKVTRIDNPNLLSMYQQLKSTKQSELLHLEDQVTDLKPRMFQPENISFITSQLDSTVNELFLFHGTSYEKAQTIAQQGFDQNLSNQGTVLCAGTVVE